MYPISDFIRSPHPVPKPGRSSCTGVLHGIADACSIFPDALGFAVTPAEGVRNVLSADKGAYAGAGAELYPGL